MNSCAPPARPAAEQALAALVGQPETGRQHVALVLDGGAGLATGADVPAARHRLALAHEPGRRHPLGRGDVVQRAEAIVVTPPVPVRQLVEPRQHLVFGRRGRHRRSFPWIRPIMPSRRGAGARRRAGDVGRAAPAFVASGTSTSRPVCDVVDVAVDRDAAAAPADGCGCGARRRRRSARVVGDREPVDVLAPRASPARCRRRGSRPAPSAAVSRLLASRPRITSSVKNSMPQFVWWMTNHSCGAEQLVGDDQRADGVVAGPTAGVADDVRVALAQAGVLGRVEPGVHARQDREPPGRRQRQLALRRRTTRRTPRWRRGPRCERSCVRLLARG